MIHPFVSLSLSLFVSDPDNKIVTPGPALILSLVSYLHHHDHHPRISSLKDPSPPTSGSPPISPMHPSSPRGFLTRSSGDGAFQFEKCTADLVAHCCLALVVMVVVMDRGPDGCGCRVGVGVPGRTSTE